MKRLSGFQTLQFGDHLSGTLRKVINRQQFSPARKRDFGSGYLSPLPFSETLQNEHPPTSARSQKHPNPETAIVPLPSSRPQLPFRHLANTITPDAYYTV